MMVGLIRPTGCIYFYNFRFIIIFQYDAYIVAWNTSIGIGMQYSAYN